MIAVDTNLLIYALREESVWHASAHHALTGLAKAPGAWAIPAPCIHEFLAVATHPRIFYPPTPLNISLDFVGTLLKSPSVEVLSEGPDYWALLNSLLRKAKVTGPKVHDARIAAFCLHHRVSELWTADRDFGRFPELATRNPLVA